MSGGPAAASARACASAPARGGSNSTASKRASFGADERPTEEVAGLGMNGAQPGRCAGGARERRDRRRVGIDGEDLVLARQPQREGAGAAEEVGDPFGALQRRRRAVGERLFARCGRLQEAAGRRRRQHVAEQDLGRPAFDDRLAVDGQARQIEPLGGDGELAPRQVVGRAGAAQIEIEPAERRRRLDVERLADAAHRRGERVGGGNRAGEAGARTAGRRRRR